MFGSNVNELAEIEYIRQCLAHASTNNQSVSNSGNVCIMSFKEWAETGQILAMFGSNVNELANIEHIKQCLADASMNKEKISKSGNVCFISAKECTETGQILAMFASYAIE